MTGFILEITILKEIVVELNFILNKKIIPVSHNPQMGGRQTGTGLLIRRIG